MLQLPLWTAETDADGGIMSWDTMYDGQKERVVEGHEAE